jgi:hypothetical protein
MKYLTMAVYWQMSKIKNQAYVPANKFVFAKAEVEAHLPRANGVSPFATSLEIVTSDTVETPRSFTRSYSQARLLGVDGEHRELGLGESTCKLLNWLISIFATKIMLTLIIPYGKIDKLYEIFI